ncbi:MAG: hybrid sensor histidine kinase/response regulator [Candidatus Wallbacteria bacterium HGW-Wallbacteria-1]|jgi:two-component system chemotaxis sensor kinase CheA|uniref:histidine kinase n=1 Tax=Candidatus Wallbacteria bacterium HGW-Wallbacteria-1 TaxID=2013854 RepID=A0A2N1PKP6_9BACT|nr:MAG: hybrid sensor histidine kinase/response regulator [Candidatus Wallbacteria bacterium HGW-Wallbacteria-1]
MSMNDDDLFQMFLEETTEHLETIERDLVALEDTGGSDDIINRIFRAIHSIKGSAGFLGWTRLKSLAHAMESVLNMMRNKALEPYPEVVTCLLNSSDILRGLVESQEKGFEEELATRITELEGLMLPPAEKTTDFPETTADQAKSEETKVAETKTEIPVAPASVPSPPAAASTPPEAASTTPEADSMPSDSVPAGSVTTGAAKINDTVSQAAAETSSETDDAAIQDHHCEASASPAEAHSVAPAHMAGTTTAARPENVASAAELADIRAEKMHQAVIALKNPQRDDDPSATVHQPQYTQQVTESLRVNVKVLDTLMTLAGELVLTRNQLLQQVTNWNREGIAAASQRLNMVTSELQEAVMSTRMQPVGNVFNKFVRIVRDLSRQLDKEVNLEIEGNAVELDKAIIEAIGDPLTHLVRNAVDHGVETRTERAETAKATISTICLKAFHEAGHVVIEVSDDGKGMNIDRIKEKAISLGLTDRFSLESLGRSEILSFIFHPGFSLASSVTDLSGRGVGMDVVQSNISKLGGSIEIDTEPGRGTKFRIKLPLTLTIIPSLVVDVQNERFAIPQANIVELVRIPALHVRNRLERLGGAVVVRVRDRLLPLLRLADVLGIEERKVQDPVSGGEFTDRRHHLDDRRQKNDRFEFQGEIDIEGFSRWLGTVSDEETLVSVKGRDERRRSHSSALNIVVVNSGDMNYGIVVDSLVDSEEIVVKPLGRNLQDCGIYAGATIRGDGRVALILDVSGIRRAAKLEMKELKIEGRSGPGAIRDRAVDAQTLLIGRHGNTWVSFPLGLISRIERINCKSIEKTGGKLGIQYRGGTLPLISMNQVTDMGPLPEKDSYFVVVFPFSGREVGILSTEIEDIIDSIATIDDLTHKQTGILGSCILNNRITLLVDPFEAIRKALPDWAKDSEIKHGGPKAVEKGTARKESEPQSDEHTTEAEQPEKEAPIILVVEDSPFFQKQIGSFITEAGYRVAMASDGIEGLELARNMGKQISLILTDIEMPGMDGVAMTKALRAEQNFTHTPVIAVTSLAGEAAEKRGLEAGINQYLIKLDREKIITAIKIQLQQARSAAEAAQA